MSEAEDWNSRIIAEFRANGGKVGGQFEGAPLALVHHTGRRSGREFVAPVMFRPDGDGRMFIFASKGGAPTNPDWYYNLTAAGSGTVEVGTETFPVTVTELTGAERDRVFAEQVRDYPGFGDYAERVKDVRVIPVLALDRIG
ncbi:MAG TPA: nitroreductase/quinone reductase family protein [Catenuloplanes sp.]